MYGTARYPHTVQFGGRFDSEGVALGRIHILLLVGDSEGVCACGLEAKGAVCAGRGRATQNVWRMILCTYCQVTGLGGVSGIWALREVVCGTQVAGGHYMGSADLVFRSAEPH